METVSLSTMSRRQGEIDAMIGHIRDLVFVRDLLAARGATAAELAEYDAVVDSARGELAECAKRAAADYATAA
jgi:hypothetical protein